jgi:hypothetical protein
MRKRGEGERGRRAVRFRVEERYWRGKRIRKGRERKNKSGA